MDARALTPDDAAMFGPGGVTIESGTTQHTGNFIAIQILVAATFDIFTERGVDAASDGMTGISIPAGMTIYNALGITSWRLSAGTVRAHKG